MVSITRVPKFVTIPGPNGSYEIAIVGRGREDSGDTYLYRDRTHFFSFAADIENETASVWDTRRLDGVSGPALSNQADGIIAQENIAHFFRTRHPFSPGEEVPEGKYATSAKFKLEKAQS